MAAIADGAHRGGFRLENRGAYRRLRKAVVSPDPLGRQVRSILMQREVSGPARAVGLEGDLGIDRLEKEVVRALRKDLDLGLAGGLGEELVPFAGDG